MNIGILQAALPLCWYFPKNVSWMYVSVHWIILHKVCHICIVTVVEKKYVIYEQFILLQDPYTPAY